MSRNFSLIFFGLVALILIAAFSPAQTETVVKAANPLDGKAVIFESTVAHLSFIPVQHVRIKRIAGRDFFSWEMKVEGEETHDYWIPTDSITKIRVFERLEDATTFSERRNTK